MDLDKRLYHHYLVYKSTHLSLNETKQWLLHAYNFYHRRYLNRKLNKISLKDFCFEIWPRGKLKANPTSKLVVIILLIF